MAKMIFFGTPEYVIPVIDALLKRHEILAVVTQPPKPVGRKQIPTPSPVARWAQQHKIQVLTDLKNLPPADIGILAAYGELVPEETIEHFPHGILNIHPSLLPKYRGASPIQGGIAAGENQTGVTIIKLDIELDHGPILAQFTESIKPDDTTGSLRERLFGKSADVLPAILLDYLEGNLTPREQDHKKATYTKIIEKENGFIPGKSIEAALRGEIINEPFPIPFIENPTLHPSPATFHNFIRALSPWPCTWTQVQLTSHQVSKLARLKILKAHIEDQKLVLDEVQIEGKNPVNWQQFVAGYPEFQFA
ncbi:MAG: methionyl-tRNA formyltransferase [bacterium]|nr:methionyl-tRNA formyltransferase [bacterium]